MRAAWTRLRLHSERGAAETVEAAIWITVLVAVVLLGVGASQILRADSSVDGAASAGARAAALARTSDEAQQAGQDAVTGSLGSRCQQMTVNVDASELTSNVPGAAVRVTVQCSMSMSVAVPGLPGHLTVTRTELFPVDSYREGHRVRS